MEPLGFPQYCVLALTAACAVTDARRGRIYDAVTLPSMAVGLAHHGFAGGTASLYTAAGGLLLGVVPFAFAAARGWIGGGDVKLFGALGSLVGAFALLEILLISFLLAALYGLTVVVRDEGARGLRNRLSSMSRRSVENPRHVRLGVFVLVATLAAMFT
jgi:prepilin peptidase CpaA